MISFVINRRGRSMQSRNLTKHLSEWREEIAKQIKSKFPDKYQKLKSSKKVIREFAKEQLNGDLKLETVFYIQNKNLRIDLDNLSFFVILIFKTIPTLETVKYKLFWRMLLNDYLYYSTYKIARKAFVVKKIAEKTLGSKADKTIIKWQKVSAPCKFHE